jgi:pimeloyl-ACP methyl ester carboxylesterase
MDFLLVHGSYHGARCWVFLAPELERLGHRVTTVDLPISDPTSGAAEYASIVEAAIVAGTEPIVVGHSMSGLVIPIVAEPAGQPARLPGRVPPRTEAERQAAARA